MLWLIIGLLIFMLCHTVPLLPAVRESLVANMGEIVYKGVYSVISLLGLILIALGVSQASFIELWTPLANSYNLTFILMPIALILLVAANVNGYIKYYLRHPMSIAIIIWALVHLAANGDMASVLLFASFGLYALISMISAERRDSVKVSVHPRLKFDVLAVIIGFIVYALLIKFHGILFGGPVI